MLRVPYMRMLQRSESASPRAKAAILLFTLCCLLSTIRILRQAPNPAHVSPDDISKQSDQRFAAVKTRLPATGVIGYIGRVVLFNSRLLPDPIFPRAPGGRSVHKSRDRDRKFSSFTAF